MPARIARLAARPPFWIPEVSVAVRSSRPSCSKAEKTRIFMADRQSSGQSWLICSIVPSGHSASTVHCWPSRSVTQKTGLLRFGRHLSKIGDTSESCGATK
jgi:hypothetical protein